MNTAKVYHDIDGNELTIYQMVKREPVWAANRIQEGEKAIEQLSELKAAIRVRDDALKDLLDGNNWYDIKEAIGLPEYRCKEICAMKRWGG